MKLDKLENIINDSFEIKEKIGPKSDKKLIKAINETIDLANVIGFPGLIVTPLK